MKAFLVFILTCFLFLNPFAGAQNVRFIIEDYEAKLLPTGKAGAKTFGKVERERYKGGEEEFELRLYKVSLPDGSNVEIFLRGMLIGSATVSDGRAVLLLNNQSGALVPVVKVGDVVEVRYGDAPILRGTFYKD